jgi:hypothetical protein
VKNTILWLIGSLLLSLSPNAAATTRYVNVGNSTPAAPYTNWVTAATNIQDALDLAVAGDQILVTNGVYQTGARAVYGMSNQVAVTKPVVVQSVNGAATTSIVGYQVPGTTNGPDAVRCVYLTNGAVLAGFTLANGATQSAGEYVGDYDEQMSGGGVWCESQSGVVSNCTLCSNSASYAGKSQSSLLILKVRASGTASPMTINTSGAAQMRTDACEAPFRQAFGSSVHPCSAQYMRARKNQIPISSVLVSVPQKERPM